MSMASLDLPSSKKSFIQEQLQVNNAAESNTQPSEDDDFPTMFGPPIESVVAKDSDRDSNLFERPLAIFAGGQRTIASLEHGTREENELPLASSSPQQNGSSSERSQAYPFSSSTDYSGRYNIQDSVELDIAHLIPPPSSSPWSSSSQAQIVSSPGEQLGAEEAEDHTQVSGIMDGQIKFAITLMKDANAPGRGQSLEKPSEGYSEGVSCEDNQPTAQLGKRRRSESLSTPNQTPSTSGQQRVKSNSVPNPKRLTARSQQLQYEKLKMPFRSPLLKKSQRQTPSEPQESKVIDGSHANDQCQMRFSTSDSPKAKSGKSMIDDARQKYRTPRAATQYKSPLLPNAPERMGNTVRMTPNVQALERKLQIVKRALRIKQEDQDYHLEKLIQKWTNAGREVAWELWALVKENDTREHGTFNQIKNNAEVTSDYSWGWSSPSDRDARKDRYTECDQIPVGEEMRAANGRSNNHGQGDFEAGEDSPQNSLGLMLRQLGIDPETLGWDEEEEGFVED
ncbi:hypothetical protein AX17_001266 [Amanita inopinata Kibby_2008]|nr:hypothetical protein AX17_001266 [Amanita inopinata Kibby_2008]